MEYNPWGIPCMLLKQSLYHGSEPLTLKSKWTRTLIKKYNNYDINFASK